jgi:hypothetical protein
MARFRFPGRDGWRRYFRADPDDVGFGFVAILVWGGAVLSVAGLIVVVVLAGWHPVQGYFRGAHWAFLGMAPLGVLVSHAGYALAYREVARGANGERLSAREATIIVTTGFGPISPRGGFAFDAQQLGKRGLPKAEAQHRIRVLGLLEYAVLAPVTFLAACYMWFNHMPAQAGLVPSWVVGVPVGAATALALLIRFRRSGRPRTWWRPLRRSLEAIDELLRLVPSRPAGLLAFTGMGIYWAGEIMALSGCLAVFAHRRGAVAVIIVGYATGYALTRRSLPLGGAGIVEVLLPLALSWVGFQLAAAVLAVVAYRGFNLWLPMVPSLLGVQRLGAAGHKPATRPVVGARA